MPSLLFAFLLLLSGGCRRTGAVAGPANRAGVLHLAAADDIPTLDPALGYDTASWAFEQMIFDTLVRYSAGGVELRPDLATAWEASSDSRRFSFHLRRDARFSTGRPVTAGDVKYAVQRVLDPKTRSQGMAYFRNIEGARAFTRGRAADVRGIETPDPWTLVFRLRAPDPLFVEKLAMPFAAALARQEVERWGEDFARHVVGSGPFMLQEWTGGQRIVLKRNPYYFAPSRPRLQAVAESLGVSEELQWLRFEAGELDLGAIAPAEFPYVMKTPRLKALTKKIVTLSVNYLGMNCQMAPFDDRKVRRAFNYAINKQKLVALLNGRAMPARGVLPPGLPGYDPTIRGYPYDPAKARQLLAEARVPQSFRPVLWLRADPTTLMLGQSVQQDLALVGIALDLKPVAWGPLLEAVRQPRTVELFLFGWEADFPDPENFLAVLFSKKQWGANNDTFYFNPQVEALLAEAAPIADREERYRLYRQAQRIIVSDAPWVFLFHPVTYVIRQPWVHGLVLNPMRPARLDTVVVAPH
ncbi:MAG: ABC transporter substrate-binding protein [Deltaproteobacteria bacterium]|nr:ABC transporter substrate-binding protein [Deltaproteobacteria bacterium]